MLITGYLGTDNSSAQTRQHSRDLAGEICSTHLDIDLQPTVTLMKAQAESLFRQRLDYKVAGGSHVQDLALQNL